MTGNDERAPKIERRGEAIRLLTLLLLCAVLFFAFLGSRPLWNVNEGMHSATSKEMILTGDWITPHHNGKPFYDKTVLHNWFVAISLMVLGFTEVAARLPAALLALGTVLVTYWMGRRMFGKWAGFFGAVVLATSVMVVVLSQTIIHDSSLCFFVTLALAFFYRGYSAEDGGGKWFLFSCASLGMALIAKGPVGLVLPAGVIFLFLAFRRDLRFLGKMQLHWGVPLGLLIGIPWFVAIGTQNGDWLYEFVVRLHLGSFLGLESVRINHPKPWYQYAPLLAGGFAPWSVFLPGAVWRAWQRRPEDVRGATALLLVWAGVYILFFSAATSKLATYLLPCYPALALLVGRLWAEVATRDAPAATARRWLTWPILVFAAIPIAIVVVLNGEDLPVERLRDHYGVGLATALTPIAALFVCLAAAAVLLWTGRVRPAFAAVAASITTCFVLLVLLIIPSVNSVQSSRKLADEMDRRVPKGERLVHYHRDRDSMLFYTDRKIRVVRRAKALRKLLEADRRVYVIISEPRYDKLEFDWPVIAKEGENLLISNREDPTPRAGKIPGE
ncbi:MAG: glycosyltransferase family 39 protein [Planctomycetota bacterium]